MQTQIGKWGGSLAVRIPGDVARELELREGMDLEVSLVNGGVVLRPSRGRYTLAELLAGITTENIHGETDWGPPVGREAW